MKTEFQKMRSEEPYSWLDSEIEASLRHVNEACERVNRINQYHPDYRAALENMIPGIPKSAIIAPPFHCDHGFISVRMSLSI